MTKYIRIKDIDDKEILINTSVIETIVPCEEGCKILFNNGYEKKMKMTIDQFDMLLDANSIDKIIANLKKETTQLRMNMQFDEIFDTIYGGKLK